MIHQRKQAHGATTRENRLMEQSFYHFIKMRNSSGSTYKSKHLQGFHRLIRIMKRPEKVLLLSLLSVILIGQDEVSGADLISLPVAEVQGCIYMKIEQLYLSSSGETLVKQNLFGGGFGL